MQSKEEVCFCESCVSNKLNCAVAFIETHNLQCEGLPKHKIKDMDDQRIFMVASKLRAQLSVDLEISEQLKAQGRLH